MKVVTSSGVGGSPVRSSATRRMSAYWSASGAGDRPAASSPDSTKASIGLRTQDWLETSGIAGRSSGCQAHQSPPRGISISSSDAALGSAPTPSAQVPPSRTHSVRIARSASGSWPVGGIAYSSLFQEIISRIRLCSGRVSSIAGPRSPPRSIASRESRRSPPFGLPSPPWQRRHSRSMIGHACVSKNPDLRTTSSCWATATGERHVAAKIAPAVRRVWRANEESVLGDGLNMGRTRLGG